MSSDDKFQLLIHVPRAILADVLDLLPAGVDVTLPKLARPDLKDGLENILRDADNANNNVRGLVPPVSDVAEALARGALTRKVKVTGHYRGELKKEPLVKTIMRLVGQDAVPIGSLISVAMERSGLSEERVRKSITNLLYNRRLFRHGVLISTSKQVKRK